MKGLTTRHGASTIKQANAYLDERSFCPGGTPRCGFSLDAHPVSRLTGSWDPSTICDSALSHVETRRVANDVGTIRFQVKALSNRPQGDCAPRLPQAG